MEDISLHLLDVAENSISAGASLIEILVEENRIENVLLVRISDNGCGMKKEVVEQILDPFYTTKNTRHVGMGLSLLGQAAAECGGRIGIDSTPGQGTTVTATFIYDHIDRKPIGRISHTIIALLTGTGHGVDIVYEHRLDGESFVFDSREIREQLEDIPIDNPEVLAFLSEQIDTGLDEIKGRSMT